VNVIQGIQLILEHNIHSQHLLELIVFARTYNIC